MSYDVKCLLEHLLLYILDNPKLNSVVLYIDAPFYDDPIPPNGVPGQAYFKVCNKSKDCNKYFISVLPI